MSFLIKHAAILLYAGFWISLSGYGLLAPPERVRLLESGLVTQGWHLTAMALIFGAPVLVMYGFSMSRAGEPLE